ncbi:N-acetylglucosamine-6-phosphate deacetylase [Ornithinimicrobium cryptoxanthini]|uniref:N-acetylglucosamine-6-phosphate deacetylase n=1 Tax=Ornithinimicrobium cryptoxanthini TaxID=2934161 RepID=A0ABY4YLG6_9MICO|nr:N-acetylglucosamine-6-phosphate deacetylase [Ornithinimicrobium cryptoxanthini]USQ76992.1 N-acetylglucosamine-6-phosphate deacetylase [Ornithinimicrobium cryptoxanthini]
MEPVQLLRAARVITPDRELADGWVAVRGDRIVEVGQGSAPQDADVTYAVLVPGLVDIHNHGGGGAAFTDGSEAALRARDAHLGRGTTTLVASLVTDSVEVLLEQVRALTPLVHSGDLAGIHLEGPWLAPRWRGAHPSGLLADPDAADVAALADAAGDALVMVTLAPERPGALEAIGLLTGRGVRVAVGHTDATYDQTRAAIGAGASMATHLYNAARPHHHREPGPSVALLEDPRVFIESIVDGVHLHPAVVRATAEAAGRRWVLVTDAMAAALMGDGSYELGTVGVEVVQGVARLSEDGALAGSTLSLDRAVRTAVGCGVPLLEAVHAATAAPAAAMGWGDVGRLEPGCRADLVALDDDLGVRAVVRHGRWVIR